MNCRYCRWERGHDMLCPENAPAVARADWDASWSKGWTDGRAGKELRPDGISYTLGWTAGIIALEEAQNGHDPKFD